MQNEIKQAQRIVVKVGSSTLTYENSKLNLNRIDKLVRDISNLKNQDLDIIFVSSGAIAAGQGKLRLNKIDRSIPEKQALASIGQGLLMKTYQKLFSEYGYEAAQILLTQNDLNDRKRYLNSRNTINQLLKYNVVPIINENDTVAVKEIKFGDNDTLSALVSSLIDADLLIMLSDIDGLYTTDPRENQDAELISEVEDISTVESAAGGSGTERGTGGMATKIEAAKIATKAGIPMIIANGKQDKVLTKIIEGKEIGTTFLAEEGLPSRDKWIAFNMAVEGELIVDSGAVKALQESGSSLLACGIIETKGNFSAGDVVDVFDQSGTKIGRGLVNYAQREVEQIEGLQSDEIEEKLGYQAYDEVIHRDNLVLSI
ncbi:glutamate 5-kinase [Halanaerobacter jeridensis]|uniref:Glutamate 5-kinase n=1 Tax=Halanaerobacter jeridensis TaxID=706427 RepID=A0A938XNS4_9FIRM|nr:glutamate 5-kinase [Halanaerobacter jeridensis]MBM7556198.1 glutamate 5-kinase [Halanaerobacter jeridensis]